MLRWHLQRPDRECDDLAQEKDLVFGKSMLYIELCYLAIQLLMVRVRVRLSYYFALG